jgi:hypothetical protein
MVLDCYPAVLCRRASLLLSFARTYSNVRACRRDGNAACVCMLIVWQTCWPAVYRMPHGHVLLKRMSGANCLGAWSNWSLAGSEHALHATASMNASMYRISTDCVCLWRAVVCI